MTEVASLEPENLPDGIRARFIDGVNGLRIHILEAGYDAPDRPCLLLLHGFPELAYSWRKVMVPLARAGFHVVAPDQRGYGRTTGWDPDYDGDLPSFGMPNLVADASALVSRLGYTSVAAVVGHDFGSPVAAWCALIKPEIFHRVALMSAPFDGPPGLAANGPDIHTGLAALTPPRKHYQWYYSTRSADTDMRQCPQGLSDFLRAYYHVKSADWPDNKPYPLADWTADALADLPRYYVMDLDRTMAETVAPDMPSEAGISTGTWLSEKELEVYVTEFARTGFQGGLQWYRCRTTPDINDQLRKYAGRQINVPACFIAGASDWGIHQVPGALDAMQTTACSQLTSCDLVPGAGHWVQQEQPGEVVRLLTKFLAAG
jgi:pimeloyl-ACP methyl ester carboxylesterase